MLDADKPDFAKLLGEVYKFYRAECTEFAINIWCQTMREYDLAAVQEALGRHVMNPDTGQFLPKPADVVKMLQGSTQDSALQAWTKLDKALREIGTYRSVTFDDPIINGVIKEMGGWICFGECKEDEWPFKRNEFITRYRGYKTRSALPEPVDYLPGLMELHNSQGNFPVEPPILIGRKPELLQSFRERLKVSA